MSASAPAPEAPARALTGRILVIGLVAVLAIGIGAVVGSFLFAARAGLANAGPAAGYVPASAPMYLEFRVLPSEAQDQALRDVLARFPATDIETDRPLADQLIEALDESLAGGEIPFTYADDVAPWFDGRVALAVTDLPEVAADPMATPVEAPGFLVLFGVTNPEAASATADRLRAEATGITFTSTDYQGTTIWASDAENGGAYAITDDQLVVAQTAEDVQAALDVRAGRADGLLGATERLGPLAARLPDDWLALFAMSGEAIQESMRAGLEGSPACMAELYDQMLADFSFDTVMAAYATGNGVAFDMVMGAPTGDLAPTNADRGLAAQVPADAILYAEGGNLGTGLGQGIAMVKCQLSALGDAVGDPVGEAEDTLDASLEDFVTWMDDAAVAAGWTDGAPWGGVVIRPSDAEAATDRLDQLAGFARLAALDPTTGVTVTEETVAGAEVTSIRFEPPAGGMAPAPGMTFEAIAVEYTVSDERVVIGIGDGFVGRVLELEPSGSLAESDRFRGAIDSLGGTNNAGASFLDLAALREAVEGAMGPMLPAEYASDVQPWLAPFDYVAFVSKVEGDQIVFQSRLVVR